MADDAGRAQDQGRRHRRAGKPSAETSTLLVRYQAAMRAELSGLLDELRGKLPPAGLLDDAGLAAEVQRPALKERTALWDLAVRLARELGTEVDPAAADHGTTGAAAPARRPRRRIDFG